MNPPPNPHAAEARAAIMQHSAPLLQNPPRDDAPPPPSLAAGLARIAAQWPDMARYAATAQIEPLPHPRGWCWGVTVTVAAMPQKGK